MAKNSSYRVIASINGGWSVKRDGAERSAKTFDTQREAIKYGENLSRSHSSELVIHGRNGRVQRKDSYGKDPNPPKG